MTQKTPISRNAKHVLTDEEKEQNTETMLAAMQAAKELEAEKKDVQNSYKTKIAEQELVVDKISNLLRVGYEIRPFNCYLFKNFDTGKREYFEYGSERLIDTEPLNAADYQSELELTEAKVKADNEASLSDLLNSGPGETTDHEATIMYLTPDEESSAEAGPDVILADPIIEELDSKTEPHEDEVTEIFNDITRGEDKEIQDDPFGGTDEEEEDPFQF
jgi:hypothetical protein